MLKFNFATKPRYIGEYAKAKCLESEDIANNTPSREAIEKQIAIQQKLKGIINWYNIGYITPDEAMRDILEITSQN